MNLPMAIVAGSVIAGAVIAVDAARTDARSHRLANRHTAALGLVAVVGAIGVALTGGRAVPAAAMAGGSALFAGPWLIAHLASPRSVGFGDVKFSAGLGLCIGWVDPLASVAAVIASGVVFLGAGAAHRFGSNDPKGSSNGQGSNDGGGSSNGKGSNDGEGRRAFGPALVVGAGLAVAARLVTGGTELW